MFPYSFYLIYLIILFTLGINHIKYVSLFHISVIIHFFFFHRLTRVQSTSPRRREVLPTRPSAVSCWFLQGPEPPSAAAYSRTLFPSPAPRLCLLRHIHMSTRIFRTSLGLLRRHPTFLLFLLVTPWDLRRLLRLACSPWA